MAIFKSFSFRQKKATSTTTKKKKKAASSDPPPRIDVKTPATAASSDADGGGAAAAARRCFVIDDGVSAMTPATGMPADDDHDDRLLRNLGMAPEDAHGENENDDDDDDRRWARVHPLHSGIIDATTNDDEAIGLPGGGVIDLLLLRGHDEDDDVSAVTGAVPSPERMRRPNAPNRILPGDDDDDDGRPTVYEEDEADSFGERLLRIDDPAPRLPMDPFLGMENAKSSESDLVASSSESADREKLKRVMGGRRSWLTRTRYFQRAIDASFDKIDVDGSGDVTLEELYAGLLLIHLQMAAYVGTPACKPASKSYVAEIFHLLDRDHSGVLTREEFSSVMKILYSQVFTRIVIQWSLTLMVVPVVSQFIIEYATALLSWMAREFSKDVDDDSFSMQSLLWRAWRLFLSCMPRWTDWTEGAMATAIDMIPSGVWKGMPLTMATVAQTSIALPYILGRVEDFFMRAAHRK